MSETEDVNRLDRWGAFMAIARAIAADEGDVPVRRTLAEALIRSADAFCELLHGRKPVPPPGNHEP
jgi:hypothetical protein